MNEAIVSKLEGLIRRENTGTPGLQCNDDAHKITLRKDVTYIVGVIAMQDDKVLMMRESKASCRGRWYIPAGRMETNENIVEAAKRETLEETGLEIEPISLILVESLYGGTWMRFTMAGRVIGGSLKMQEDKESMEAQWYFPSEIRSLPIRATDMIYLVDLGVKWFKRNTDLGHEKIFKSLPVLQGHSCLKSKVILVKHPGTNHQGTGEARMEQDLKILLFDKPSYPKSLPQCVLKRKTIENFEEAIYAAAESCGFQQRNFDIKGILSVEHSGNSRDKSDGLCCTFLAEINDPLTESQNNLSWLHVTDSILNHTIRELLEPGMCVAYLIRH